MPGNDATEHPYAITLSLNVLNHLGITLYSNVPAVISEIVANAWDADATQVDITIDKKSGKLTITDNGSGMTRAEVNGRYLNVGYQRRLDPTRPKAERGRTPILRRPVMGRKGIGKLSIFSIANNIDIQTVKDGEVSALRMNAHDLRKEIESEDGADGTYYPDPLPEADVKITRGTRLVLSDLKRGLGQTPSALRRRLARRFSVIGAAHQFEVNIDGTPISVADRDYFHKVQYLWTIGAGKDEYLDATPGRTRHVHRSGTLPSGAKVSGWIGTAAKSTALKDEYDSLNRIVLMVRGKLAQEDVLDEFNEGGVYVKYVFGELHADFLDLDDEDDIATSSRQRIIEDDPRYIELLEFVRLELKNIQNNWTEWRNREGESKAREIPEVDSWFETLSTGARKKARSLLGKINQLTVDNEADRRRLVQHAVLAFETLRYKENLDSLDDIDAENVEHLVGVFGALDDIEAALYHRIVNERLVVIETLNEHIHEDVLEKVVQDHLFEHLWLLDPSWERATDGAFLEQSVEKEFEKITRKTVGEERSGRADIKYRKTSGAHVIVELKRPGRTVSTYELLEQVAKYRAALRKHLDAAGRASESIEVVCVVGRPLKDWAEPNGRPESNDVLAAKATRVTMYQELLDQASQAYKAYMEKRADAGRVQTLINALDADLYAESEPENDAQ